MNSCSYVCEGMNGCAQMCMVICCILKFCSIVFLHVFCHLLVSLCYRLVPLSAS
nr:MAG TPA: hypothetical protein [Bacteriophage sp.]